MTVPFLFYFSLLSLLISLAVVCSLRHRYIAAAIASSVSILFSRILMMAGSSPLYYHDEYFYMSVATAIQEQGSVIIPDGALEWYDPSRLADWSILQVLTVSLANVTGVSVEAWMHLLPALLAVILFLVVAVTYGSAVGYRFGIIGGLILVMLDPFWKYLSQYHGQGAGVTFLALVIGIVLLHAEHRTRVTMWMLFFGGAAFAMVHRFTALFALIVFGALVAAGIAHRGIEHRYGDIGWPVVPSLIVGSLLLTFQLFVDPSFLVRVVGAILQSGTAPPPVGSESAGQGATVIDSFSVLLKLLLPLIALPSMYLTARYSTNLRPWLALLVVTGAVGIPIGLMAGDATARVVLLGYIPLVPFVVRTLQLSMETEVATPGARTSIVAIAAISIILMGSLAGVMPSFVDHDADIKDDGYHEIRPLGEHESTATGEFISSRHDGPIYVDFYSRMVAIYYGVIPQDKVDYPETGPDAMGVYDSERRPIPESDTLVYTNGRLYLRGCDQGTPECQKGRLDRINGSESNEN